MRMFALAAAFLISAATAPAASAGGKPSKILDYAKAKYALPISVAAGEAAPVLAQLSAKERAALEKKGLVVSNSLAHGDDIKGVITAYLIVNQPKARVWELLRKPGLQELYLPRLEKSKLVREGENRWLGYFKIKVSFVTVEYQSDHVWWPESSRMAWALDPDYDNDLKVNEGYYHLYAIDDQTTLMELGTQLETSALVPRFVQEYLTKTDLPEVMAAVKKYMDSNGTYRK